VVAICTWSGIALAPSKCYASGILHGTAGKPTDWSGLEPLLKRVTMPTRRLDLVIFFNKWSQMASNPR